MKTNQNPNQNEQFAQERELITQNDVAITEPAGYVYITDGYRQDEKTRAVGRLLEAETLCTVRTDDGNYNYIAMAEDYTTTDIVQREPAITSDVSQSEFDDMEPQIDKEAAPEYGFALDDTIDAITFDPEDYIVKPRTVEKPL